MQTDDLRPLEEIRAAIARIERALVGDLSTSTPGVLERQRKAEERLDEQQARLERHSTRLHALETAGGERARWTLRTILDGSLRAGLAAAIGAIAAILGARPPHH